MSWLRDWGDIHSDIEGAEHVNPIDVFVHENEPAGKDSRLFRDQLEKALKYVEDDTRMIIESEPQWQPIETAPLRVYVLVYDFEHGINVAKKHSSEVRWRTDSYPLSHVTHWMPLPNPPETEE